VIHAHTALLDGAAAAELKAKFDVPLVLTEHTGPLSVITRTRHMRRRVHRALLNSDRVVAVSNALARTIRQTFPELNLSIDIIPNGVDERLFAVVPQLPVPSLQKTILWIGSFDPLKRPLLALEAFAAIAKRRPEFNLHFIGRGSLEAVMRREVERLGLGRRVRIDDYYDRVKLAGVMSRASMLMVTSIVETFSLVTIEALSSGVPVVSTRCGGPEDILVEPWLGRLSEDSLEALTAALLEITSTLADFPAERMRAYAVDRFGMNVVAKRYIALYQAVMSGLPATTR
jgi:glycosyltransferase involved in cell wall biosynthesis